MIMTRMNDMEHGSNPTDGIPWHYKNTKHLLSSFSVTLVRAHPVCMSWVLRNCRGYPFLTEKQGAVLKFETKIRGVLIRDLHLNIQIPNLHFGKPLFDL